MALGDKYVMNGVWLTCDKGVTPSRFNVTPKPVELYDEHFANELDKIPLVNIQPFGACSVTQTPCAPAPLAWERVMDDGLLVLGARPLLDTSKCMCSVGGKIAIHFNREDAMAAVALDQKLDVVDEVADAAEQVSGWAFWGGIACAVGGAILVATGVGAPLGAALIVGGAELIEASTALATAAAVVKGATKFARDPSLQNGLSIVGEVVENLVINYVMNKLGGAVVKRLGKFAQKAMKKLKLSDEARALANRLLCTVTGHPVDVISGYLYTEATDFEFPGPLPLRWERFWNSTSIHEGPLGHGWHHAYDLALVVEESEGYAALRAADGRGLAFDVPALGARAYNRLEKMSLVRDERGYGVLDHGQGLTYRFGLADAEGVRQLAAVENANGFAIRFTYDERGHLLQIVDSAQRVFAVQTDAAGRLLTISTAHPTEPKQRVTLVTYAYSGAGELVAVTDALGQVARYHYQQHLLVQETFKNGLNFYFEYAGHGPAARCVHTWGDEGIYDHRLAYDVAARRTVVTNSLGYATTYFGNENGLVVEVQDARGGVTLTEYNEFNDVLSETDQLGYTTTYQYDERGNCLAMQRADGSQQQQAYDVSGRLVSLTDAVGQQEQWQYDQAGNLLLEIKPGDLQTAFTYDQGLPASRTNAAGQRTTLHYDAAHNLQEVRRSTSNLTRTLYDGWGRPLKLTDARGNVQWRTYDLLNRAVTVHEPDGDVRRFTYDAVGNITRLTNRQYEVQYAYRGMSRLIRRSVAGTAVEFLYDTEEQVRGLLNEHGLLYYFELDALGQVVAETSFDGQQRHYTRDVGGRVLEVQLPTQQRVHYAYDPLGRVTTIRYDDGSQDAFTYGLDGELLTATNAATSVRFERGRADNVLRETQGTYQVTSHYDLYGRRATLTSSLGAVVGYRRNVAGAVTQMEAGDWQAAFERDDQGLEVQRQLSGGVRLDWQHDALGRPLVQRISTGARRQVRQRQYSWQLAEQLTQIQDNELGTTQFEHDARGNLARTRFSEQEIQVRQPDAVGNLFRTEARTDRHYGAAGQLLQADGTRYTYDALGNLTHKLTTTGEEWRYAWNGARQLTSVLRPDGQRVAFEYDALGRRISKQYRGQVTRWVWDGHVPLHEWREAETPADLIQAPELITWVFEGESLVPAAKLTTQGASSIACDHLGTPLSMYDGQGRQTWDLELDSYGAVRRGRGRAQDCPFRYQGQYEDVETGLYYNRFRYYDPEAGQYISQDPIGLLGGSTLMSYVADPLVQIDALGLSEGSGALGRRLVSAGNVPSQSGVTFVKSDFRAHHVIPHEVWTSNQTFFDDIGLNHVSRQINPKDAISNGVMLPGTEAVGRQYGFDAYHAGGHPQTNDAMRVRVEDVRDRFRALPVQDDAAKRAARQEIAAIQNAERTRLSARNRGGCAMMP